VPVVVVVLVRPVPVRAARTGRPVVVLAPLPRTPLHLVVVRP
jgi:hypothetical protein